MALYYCPVVEASLFAPLESVETVGVTEIVDVATLITGGVLVATDNEELSGVVVETVELDVVEIEDVASIDEVDDDATEIVGVGDTGGITGSG